MAPRRRPTATAPTSGGILSRAEPAPPASATNVAAQQAAAATAGAAIGGAPFGTLAATAALAASSAAHEGIVASTTAAVLAILASLGTSRRAALEGTLVLRGIAPADIAHALAVEDQREVIYRKLAAQRVEAGVALALKAKDPSARAAGIQAVLAREQRFAELHAAAAAERVLGAAERQDMRERSPQGAMWNLGATENHCPLCTSLAGKFWPWSVLDKLPIPLHILCGCYLTSYGDAIHAGKLAPGDIPSAAHAHKLAAPAIAEHREQTATATAKYAHLTESVARELAVRAVLLEQHPNAADFLAAAPLAVESDESLQELGFVSVAARGFSNIAYGTERFNPSKHPRDPEGRFAEALNSLNRSTRRVASLSGGTFGHDVLVTRKMRGFEVAHPSVGIEHFTDAAAAAKRALGIHSAQKKLIWAKFHPTAEEEEAAVIHTKPALPEAEVEGAEAAADATERSALAEDFDPAEPRDVAGRWSKLADVLDAHPNVETAVHERGTDANIAVGLIRTRGDDRGKGYASAFLRDLTAYADQHKKTIALTADPVGKGGLTKSKLASFYGRHGFVPNKGRNRDLSFTESMIRPPQ